MNRKPSLPPSKMPDVGTTIFTEMTALAQAHGALNVAQGFPDLPTPVALRRVVADAMEDGHNQYAPMPGNKALRDRGLPRFTTPGPSIDPDNEITVVLAHQVCCTRPCGPSPAGRRSGHARAVL